MSAKQRRLLWPTLTVGVILTMLLLASAWTKSALPTAEAKGPQWETQPGDIRVGRQPEASSSLTISPLPVRPPGEVRYRPTYRVQVHKDCLRPDLIHASPGKIILDAGNETEEEVSLVVERIREHGQPHQFTGKVKVSGGRKRARQELELGAGEYVIYDEAHPAVRGRIVVAPR